ncbi:MAG: glycosyltransferase, partial [Myxococcales bacterium]
LGRPALLLTRFREQLPAQLPPHARHEPFVPLGALLPRAAAIVHHGGIGTCAQALASGTPQLVMPTGFDQLDNAARLRRLGAGAALSRRQFRPDAVERALRDLLESPAVAASCLAASQRLQAFDAAARACDAIERA